MGQIRPGRSIGVIFSRESGFLGQFPHSSTALSCWDLKRVNSCNALSVVFGIESPISHGCRHPHGSLRLATDACLRPDCGSRLRYYFGNESLTTSAKDALGLPVSTHGAHHFVTLYIPWKSSMPFLQERDVYVGAKKGPAVRLGLHPCDL